MLHQHPVAVGLVHALVRCGVRLPACPRGFAVHRIRPKEAFHLMAFMPALMARMHPAARVSLMPLLHMASVFRHSFSCPAVNVIRVRCGLLVRRLPLLLRLGGSLFVQRCGSDMLMMVVMHVLRHRFLCRGAAKCQG